MAFSAKNTQEYFYTVTAYKATSTYYALKGNFTGPSHLNLILGKSSHIEILKVTTSGLEPVLDVDLYARIAHMELYRPPNLSIDILFVTTVKHRYCALSYDPEKNEIKTEASGDLRERGGTIAQGGQVAIVDPYCRAAAVHAYQGLLRVIPMYHPRNAIWFKGGTGNGGAVPDRKMKSAVSRPVQPALGDLSSDSFTIRMDDLLVHAIVFLDTPPATPDVPKPTPSTPVKRSSSSSASIVPNMFSSSTNPNFPTFPTIAIISEDVNMSRKLKIYSVDFEAKELRSVKDMETLTDIDKTAHTLIPVQQPWGGVIIIGEESFTYVCYSPKVCVTVDIVPPKLIKCWCPIGGEDRKRFLLADVYGRLFLLFLVSDADGEQIVDMKLEQLGETSLASAIAYLDNGYVFIGSHFGDSQLVKLLEEQNALGAYLKIVDTYNNLAPIRDFRVVDLEKQGQGQIVAVCGGFKGGSVRVIRNGIGINEIAELEVHGLKNVFSLRQNYGDIFDSLLIMSFVRETRTFLTTGEGEMIELESDNVGSLATSEQTLFCANAINDQIVQVTESQLLLMDCEGKVVTARWASEDGKRISHAAGSPTQVLLAVGRQEVYYFEIGSQNLNLVGKTTMEHDISCVDITPWEADGERASHVLVGLWTDISIRLLAIPTLEQVAKENLGGEILCRSVLTTAFEGIRYVFAALADGHLFSFVVNTSPSSSKVELTSKKRVSLGSQPINLRRFRSNDGKTNVFASSDRPTVIYSSNQKLLFSNVNMKEATTMTPYNIEATPHSLALVSGDTLRIGTMDQIQKLHVRTFPIGEDINRIAYQESTSTFAILSTTMRPESGENEDGTAEMSWTSSVSRTSALRVTSVVAEEMEEQCFLRVLDGQTFEVISTFKLDTNEKALALESMTFPSSTQEYYVVGTAYILPEEDDPRSGRVLVFEVGRPNSFDGANGEAGGMAGALADAWSATRPKLTLLAERKVEGAVFAIASLKGRLIAAVNSKIQVYGWEGSDATAQTSSSATTATGATALASLPAKLVPICAHHGNVVVILLSVYDDKYIAVGDMLKSVTILEHIPATMPNFHDPPMLDTSPGAAPPASRTGTPEHLVEVARDFGTVWTTSVHALDDTTVVGTDDSDNMLIWRRRVQGQTEDERRTLSVFGVMHLGHSVNRIRSGSLVMQLGDTEEPVAKPKMLFCTVEGMIGVIATVSAEVFGILSKVEENMTKYTFPVGNLEHFSYRTYETDRIVRDRTAILDGDLLEQLLDMPKQVVQAILNAEKGGLAVDCTVEDVLSMVEELSRIH
ncbi:mono-functional DNA-alkylating methyl methanesulfonate N-term-domain-containing protein [Cladochytrium replicatum]|nr:mono-functional DNA-alkylating methyl methanesulfonate N-term-domain-containing protein [Cladochytrium replicatum]